MVMAEPRRPPALLPRGPGPVRVGFYDIEGTLGKGNFAVVKLARHRITRSEVSRMFNLFLTLEFFWSDWRPIETRTD